MFNDLKVLDVSTVLAGPSVGSFFAELGSKVIKIENPKIPDVTRSWKLNSEDPNSNVSAYFSSVNYKKEYLQLDFNSETDKDIFLNLVKDSDILISNFKKGDAEKFKITNDILFDLNPLLIHGKINGYGSDSDRVAYDLILQAETGFMSMNGTPESGPVKMPVALIDVLAAHHLKEGILIALLNREKTKKGCSLNVSLYDAAVCSLMNQASNYLMENKIPSRIGSLHPNIAPYGEIFETQDKKLVTFAIGSDMHFIKLCNYLELSDLPDKEAYKDNQNRVKNRIQLFQILKDAILRLDSNEILAWSNEQFVPFGIIKSLDEVFIEKQAKSLIRNEIIDNVSTKRLTSIAFKYD